MGIFDKGLHIDPKYQFLEKYVHIMYRGMWTPAKYEKLINEVDVPHFENHLNDIDKEFIRRCILAISIVEDKVKTYWSTLALDLPQTIIGDVGGLFGQSEVTHRRSYHALAQSLGVKLEDVVKYKALDGRVKYLTKHIEKDPKIIGKKRVLKTLVLFTLLVEGISLPTQFYSLMSYAYHNKGLKTISALQESTAIEENVHFSFGVDIVNIIKEEYPQLWDEYLVELVEKSIMESYKAELNLIDWFIEEGTPSHLSKEELINFLNYNFDHVCKSLDLDLKFEYDEDLFEEKNAWFRQKVFMTTEPDFFDNAVSGYASDDEEIDIDNIKFEF